ncbi:multidrug efflux pump subunit AcrB [Sinobacterium caligoides]|uniref:Multidrug efflux pump subunit AcrB n=1 Tax=Sinobacterium caligoides TaxID=933926 RepID=A0A3N2DY96_9GAMM|nr:efflux RND transporter permease subunit [Sinobacterium caligoides]ROS04846.1 multidrug efflux pump subunit AcrB [Sinobacterium caligoides]
MKLFLESPRMLILLVALLLVSGLGALKSLPRMEDPHLLNRFAIVTTTYPGASAERVEALVTEPVESELRRLSEIDEITSISRPGVSIISMMLKPGVTESTPVWSRARDHISDVAPNLPSGASVPSLNSDRGYAFTTLIALRWQGDSQSDIAILGRYARELESRLRVLPGSEYIELFGMPKEEVLVEVNADVASSLRLSSVAIAEAIQSADAKVAAGQIYGDRNQFQVELGGSLDTIERIREVPVITGSNGRVYRVGDLAEIRREVQYPPSDIASVEGRDSVVVAVRMDAETRITDWMQRVDNTVATLQADIPSNIAIDTIFDQRHYTESRLEELVGNILLGFTLVVIVLLVTLGWRSAIIVALSLPLTLMFTLSCMQYYGLPIHQMSVTGLVVALGIMVDNAIVMVESIAQKRQQGVARLTAVRQSLNHLWLPLLGSTMTTILAFLPIVLMPGSGGEFVGGIALSVIFSLIGSYLISHTIIASLAGSWLPEGQAVRRSWYQTGIELPKVSARFEALLAKSIARPKTSIGLALLLPLLGFVAAGQLTNQFFPPSDRDMFHIELYMSPQSSIIATRAMTEKLDEVMSEQQEIQSVSWFVGKSAPSFYYNLLPRQRGANYYAQAMVTAESFKAANRLIPLLQQRFDKQFPSAQVLVRKLEQGPPFNAPVEMRILGPNLDVLKTLGEEVQRVLLTTDNVIHTRATLQPGAPKIWLDVNEEASLMSGMKLTDLALQLQTNLHGILRGSVIEATELIPVRIRVGDKERKDLAALGDLSLPTVAGEKNSGVRLSALADLELRPSRGAIPHRDGQRVNVIEAYLRADVLPDSVLTAFKQKLAEQGFDLPAGYRLETGGESAKRADSINDLMTYVTVILVLLVAVLVLSFNSFKLGAIILMVAMQAAGLGLLCVYLSTYPFGFTVIIAVLGLIGLAINAAIVILAELESDERARAGDADAIVAAVMSCARHITSTTITTVGGFLPLILAGGGFWPPFAIAIAGGTVLTTILSFCFVPAAFKLSRRLNQYTYGSSRGQLT